MKTQIEDTKFESIYDELKYEIQDVINLLNHILGENKKDPTVIDLFKDYVRRPANDNWPICKTRNDKTIKRNIL